MASNLCLLPTTHTNKMILKPFVLIFYKENLDFLFSECFFRYLERESIDIHCSYRPHGP